MGDDQKLSDGMALGRTVYGICR